MRTQAASKALLRAARRAREIARQTRRSLVIVRDGGLITAALTNTTAVPIQTPFFRVAELSGGNLLVNGDMAPTVAAISGRGARLTPDVGTDGVLSPGESVTVVFAIGLQTRQPFRFFVNVLGVAEGSP